MIQRSLLVLVSVISWPAWVPTDACGRTIHVPGDQSTIQGAIEVAQPGDEVVVAAGTYSERLDFVGKAITVRSVDPADSSVVAATVVDAGGTGSVVTFASAEDRGAVLSGLTLTGGGGTVIRRGNSGGASTAGGGVYIHGASPRVEDCIVRENVVSGGWITTGGMGGGIHCAGGGVPLITRTRIEANTSTKYGGGLSVDGATRPTVLACSLVGNEAVPGSGWATSGGGLFLRGTSGARIIRTEVRGNRAGKDGGGLQAQGAQVSILGGVFHGNVAEGDYGGGLNATGGSRADVANTIFAQNEAAIGAGLQAQGATVNLDNCTFAGNVADIRGGAIFDGDGAEVRANNCVLWFDSPDEVDHFGTRPGITYSSVRGGWTGEGNVPCGPRFISYDGFELVLGPGSTCIDAGDPAVEDGVSDWHPLWPGGYPNGARSDMGAYGGPRNGDWLSW